MGTWIALGGAISTCLFASGIIGAMSSDSSSGVVPSTPVGLPACDAPLTPEKTMPQLLGERLRYDVEVIGIPLGQIDLEVARRGLFRGESVTEYRGRVLPATMVDAMVTVEGSAAALVPDRSFSPVQSRTRYRFRGDEIDELRTYEGDGRQVVSHRTQNGRKKTERRDFHAPVHDFMTGFHLLRRLPVSARGCAVLYANQKAYTIWVSPEGREKVDTGKGSRLADRYRIRYGSDRTKKVREARVWISTGPERVPIVAEGLNSFSPVARLSDYRRGH